MFYRLPPRQHRTVITRIGGAQYAWELVYNISIVYQIIFWHCRCSAVIRGHNFDMCDIGTPIGHKYTIEQVKQACTAQRSITSSLHL